MNAADKNLPNENIDLGALARSLPETSATPPVPELGDLESASLELVKSLPETEDQAAQAKPEDQEENLLRPESPEQTQSA